MFKLIFRFMVISVFLVFLVLGLALWKGGSPFRWIGERTVSVGEAMSEFGDFVDNVRKGSKKVRKTFNEIKDTVASENEK